MAVQTAQPKGAASRKRAQCFSLNATIIRISQAGTLPDLMNIIGSQLPRMNVVNLTTALHRIAKIAASNKKTLSLAKQHRTLWDLLSSLHHAYETLGVSAVDGQSLSNNAWSLATLQVVGQPLHDKIVDLATMKLSSFKAFELSNLLWALAKMMTLNTQTKGSTQLFALFQAAANHIVTQIHLFNFRSLATVSWAFATSKARHARLFQCMAANMVHLIPSASVQELSNTAWAFATARIRSDVLLSAIANQAVLKLDQFKPQELSNIIWAFSTADFFHEELYSCAHEMAPQMNLQPQHLANIIWSYARAEPRAKVTNALIVKLLPSCTEQLDSFKAQEVASIAHAVRKAWGPIDGQAKEQDLHTLPTEVLDYFAKVLPWLRKRLPHLPSQYFVNIVGACVAMNAHPNLDLTDDSDKINGELMRRIDSLNISSMLYLLNSLASSFQYIHSDIAAALYARLANHVEELKGQSVELLARITGAQLMCNMKCQITTEELRRRCLLLSTVCRQGADSKMSANNRVGSDLSGVADCCTVETSVQADNGQGDEVSTSSAVETLNFPKRNSTSDVTLLHVASEFIHVETTRAPQCRSVTPSDISSEQANVGPVKCHDSEKCRVFVKNSFLHVEEGEHDSRYGSMQHSASVPSHLDIGMGHRRCFQPHRPHVEFLWKFSCHRWVPKGQNLALA